MREIKYDKTKDKEYDLACIKCDGETCHNGMDPKFSTQTLYN